MGAFLPDHSATIRSVADHPLRLAALTASDQRTSLAGIKAMSTSDESCHLKTERCLATKRQILA